MRSFSNVLKFAKILKLTHPYELYKYVPTLMSSMNIEQCTRKAYYLAHFSTPLSTFLVFFLYLSIFIIILLYFILIFSIFIVNLPVFYLYISILCMYITIHIFLYFTMHISIIICILIFFYKFLPLIFYTVHEQINVLITVLYSLWDFKCEN